MHSEPRLPRTLANLRRWLCDTDQGREIVREMTADFLEEKCQVCQSPFRKRPRVLVVTRRLGRYPVAQVYRDAGVTVKLVELVDSFDDPTLEALCDELLETQVPRFWRDLLWRRSDEVNFTGLSAGRRKETIIEGQLIKELRAIGEYDARV